MELTNYKNEDTDLKIIKIISINKKISEKFNFNKYTLRKAFVEY